MEPQSLAIVVIDENIIRALILEAGLRESRHDNVTVVHDLAGVARTIAAINPDVIFIDLEASRHVSRPLRPRLDRSYGPNSVNRLHLRPELYRASRTRWRA